MVHGYRAQVAPPGAGWAVRDDVYDEAGRAQPLGIVVDLAPSIRMTHSELGAGTALCRARRGLSHCLAIDVAAAAV